MEPLDYLRIVRRRWIVIAAATVVAIVAAAASTAIGGSTAPAAKKYQATTVLLRSFQTSEGPHLPGTIASASTVAALATFDPVPRMVAEEIGFGSPAILAASVAADYSPTSGLLDITVTWLKPQQATVIADAFAEQLIRSLADRQAQAIAEQRQRLGAQLLSVQRRIDAQVAAGKTSGPKYFVLTAERDQARTALQVLAGAQPDPGLEVIQPAAATAAPTSASGLPVSTTARLLLGLLLGLLAGLSIALLLERLDTLVRTKEVAEAAFAAPVLAEVPTIPRAFRHSIITASQPLSPAAEAFRLLGAEILGGGLVESGDHDGQLFKPPRTILVTSAGPSEGKTTIVANLAVAIAETGRSVIVLSCDFRRPSIHHLFEVPNLRGLADALAAMNGKSVLTSRLCKTPFSGVLLVPSGVLGHHQPGELLSSEGMGRVIDEARISADVVLLDTAPLLTVSDAAYLLPDVDAVLLVAHARRTITHVAARTAELLHRLGPKVSGVVLNASAEMALPRKYRSYYRNERAHLVDEIALTIEGTEAREAPDPIITADPVDATARADLTLPPRGPVIDPSGATDVKASPTSRLER